LAQDLHELQEELCERDCPGELGAKGPHHGVWGLLLAVDEPVCERVETAACWAEQQGANPGRRQGQGEQRPLPVRRRPPEADDDENVDPGDQGR
jgi:hypothetical protein